MRGRAPHEFQGQGWEGLPRVLFYAPCQVLLALRQEEGHKSEAEAALLTNVHILLSLLGT